MKGTWPSQGLPDGGRGETRCVGVRIRLPLRVLLPCVAVCWVACGAAAIGAVCVQAAGGSVMRQADEGLAGRDPSRVTRGRRTEDP